MSSEVHLTAEQRALARHALGLPNKRSRSYRKHYIIYGGAEHKAWVMMVEAGAARRWGAPFGGMELFHLTRTGALAALDPGETLDPEDFPDGQ